MSDTPRCGEVGSEVYVCTACHPGAVEIAEFGEKPGRGLCLFEQNGRYGLMQQPGHGDDVLLWFPDKPTPMPPDGPWTEAGEYANPHDKHVNDAWEDAVERFEKTLLFHPEVGYWFVKDCKAAGWGKKPRDPDTNVLSQWVFGLCGSLLAKWEQEREAKGE